MGQILSDLYAVLGNPIEHSRSPVIHRLFAQQTGQDLQYFKHEVPLGEFGRFVDDLRQQGYKGVNVTVPFKTDAQAYAQRCSQRVVEAGAANTLKFEGDDVFADNTDGWGLCQDIVVNAEVPLHGKTILLVGAGGAARGVLVPLLERQPARLVLANRTHAKALEVVNNMGLQSMVEVIDFDHWPQSGFDVIINATSAGLGGQSLNLPAHLFSGCRLAYDMVYGAFDTPFMKWAHDSGCIQIRDGLGMLVEQAAKAFEWWRGVMPKTEPVLGAVRAQLMQQRTA